MENFRNEIEQIADTIFGYDHHRRYLDAESVAEMRRQEEHFEILVKAYEHYLRLLIQNRSDFQTMKAKAIEFTEYLDTLASRLINVITRGINGSSSNSSDSDY